MVADLRTDSPTRGGWSGRTLSAGEQGTLIVPLGAAHGFLTLEPESEVGYLIEGAYRPEAALVVRWNDPAFSIEWPMEPTLLSERDREAPDWKEFL